jgi:hypothetical protein
MKQRPEARALLLRAVPDMEVAMFGLRLLFLLVALLISVHKQQLFSMQVWLFTAVLVEH